MVSQTRTELVRAATELLDEGGLDAVTLREVGRRAGVSHNAPYKHYSDKEALLAAVAAAELRRHGATLMAIREEQSSPAGVLGSVLRQYIAWAMAYPARFKLVFGVWTTGSAELAEAADDSRKVLVEIVIDAQREGVLPDASPERMTALLQAVLHGAVDLSLIGHLARSGKGRADPDDLVDDLLGYLRMAAAANGASAGASASLAGQHTGTTGTR
jgi:AcrR family transcriptional regulator